jgi:hypothetical protein
VLAVMWDCLGGKMTRDERSKWSILVGFYSGSANIARLRLKSGVV